MRNILILAAGLGLAGCSSFSMPEMFKSTPPSATVQLESLPPGADARVSNGQSCKTPCSLVIPAAENLSVTFSLPKYQSETVAVQIMRDQVSSSGGALVDPNPVYAELQPAAPAPKGRKGTGPKAAPKAKKPKTAAAPPAADSPFPPPPSR